jgi:hypothetical protein
VDVHVKTFNDNQKEFQVIESKRNATRKRLVYWLGRGVGGLGGPRSGVDGLCRLCCGAYKFLFQQEQLKGIGGRPSVFQRSPSLLLRWGDAWGCGGERTAVWASFGRGQLQQACGFTAV